MQLDKLNVTHLDKESFIKLLNYVCNEIETSEIFFSRKNNKLKDLRESISLNPRIDICLSGIKHMMFSGIDRICDVFMKPGQVHYCPPMLGKQPVWDTEHEMSSIIYTPHFIRLTYIDFNKSNPMSNSAAAKIFYHTSLPIGEPGKYVLNALDVLSTTDNDSSVGCLLVKSLLKLTLEQLKKEEKSNLCKSDLTWSNIKHYMYENFYYPINRAHVAKEFNLNPSYVSRLFAEKSNESFNATLRRFRMEYAALLLKNTDMSIEEITDRCGYLSTTSFSETFKTFYGQSPGRYRNSLAGNGQE